VLDFFSKLFDARFMPHGHCFFWLPEILWLHVVSDGLIAGSYFLMPFALIQLARKRRDLAFHWMFFLFGAFILACGATHVMSIWTLWIPMYRLEGVIKAATALVSVPTAILLIRLLPHAIALPSPAQLRSVNLELQNEISERKAAEERVRSLNEMLEDRVAQRTKELEDANRALRIANENLEQFAFSASHDLKEPLRNVAIYSQLLQKRYNGRFDDEANHFLGYLVQGAQRMDRLVTDLLIYTRVGVADQLEVTPVHSGKVLGIVLENLSEALKSHQVAVTSDSLPIILMSETSLEQVLQNLIENAIKYRSEGVSPAVHVSATLSSGDWLFSVSDNGIGIAPEYHEQVFGIFKRLHGAGSKISGTGMGLAICRRIVSRAGGRIWVESALGEGSTFYFTVPASQSGQERG